MINGLGSNPLDRLAQIKDQADLKSKISQLTTQLESASSKEAKAKIGAQLESLAAQSGQSLQSLGVDTGSIFNPKMAIAPTTSNASAHTSYTPTSGPTTPTPISGEIKSLIDQNKGVDNHQAWTRGNREEEMSIMRDIHEEFGVYLYAEGDKAAQTADSEAKLGTTLWTEKSVTDDRITVYDRATGEIKNGQAIQEDDIIEFKSEKHGVVRLQSGGDGNLDGGDDIIVSKGGQAAATGAQNGLNSINNSLPAIAKPELAGLVDKVENPQKLSDVELKNLLAAILQLVNQSSK